MVSKAPNSEIDRACLRFEDALQTESPLTVQEVVESASPAFREELLKELLLIDFSSKAEPLRGTLLEERLSEFPSDSDTVHAAYRITSSPTQPSLVAGQRIGRYEIVRQVGAGAFGAVYAAKDTELDRTVAIKVPRFTSETSGFDIENFVTEAKTLASLDHPGIVPIYHIIRLDCGAPLLVMQHVEGQSLRSALDEQGLSREQGLQLLAEVASAAHYAHQRGIVHRDLTPRNILIDEIGHARVIDFGLAIHETRQEAAAGEAAGSLRYMSPEQLRGESHWLDGRADIWAIGVTMYELLTGRLPFRGQDLESISEEVLCHSPKPPRQIDSAVSRSAEEICLKCLEVEPSRRFSNAGDLAVAISELRPMRSRITKWRSALAAAAVILGLCLWSSLRVTDPTESVPTNSSLQKQLASVDRGELSLGDLQIRKDFRLNLTLVEGGRIQDTPTTLEPVPRHPLSPRPSGRYQINGARKLRISMEPEENCEVTIEEIEIDRGGDPIRSVLGTRTYLRGVGFDFVLNPAEATRGYLVATARMIDPPPEKRGMEVIDGGPRISQHIIPFEVVVSQSE